VGGLEPFRDRFEDFLDCYILIGGAASQLAMAEEGLEFRATKDLDIVLCIEALDARFVEAFWTLVRDGGYKWRKRLTGPRRTTGGRSRAPDPVEGARVPGPVGAT